MGSLRGPAGFGHSHAERVSPVRHIELWGMGPTGLNDSSTTARGRSCRQGPGGTASPVKQEHALRLWLRLQVLGL